MVVLVVEAVVTALLMMEVVVTALLMMVGTDGSYKFSFLVRSREPVILFIKPAGPLRCWLGRGLVIRRPSRVITFRLSLSKPPTKGFGTKYL